MNVILIYNDKVFNFTMLEYKVKISNNGRIVIPLACRKQMHLKNGSELILRLDNHIMHLMSIEQSLKDAQKLVQKYSNKRSLLKELRSLRNEDE